MHPYYTESNGDCQYKNGKLRKIFYQYFHFRRFVYGGSVGNAIARRKMSRRVNLLLQCAFYYDKIEKSVIRGFFYDFCQFMYDC